MVGILSDAPALDIPVERGPLLGSGAASSVDQILEAAQHVLVTDKSGRAEVRLEFGEYLFCIVGEFPTENQLWGCPHPELDITQDTTVDLGRLPDEWSGHDQSNTHPALPPGASGTSVITFGTVSSYMEDAPLVIRPRVAVEFITAEDVDAWWREVLGSEVAPVLDKFAAFYPRGSTISRLSTPTRTNADGLASIFVEPGPWLACAHFPDPNHTMIAGCADVAISDNTTIYVFFDNGRAHIDTGHGAASGAYRRLSCHQQLRLGQQPDHLVLLGGSRYRCLSR